MLQHRLGISQRRACAIVGQHRSTQRHAPQPPHPDRGCGPSCDASPGTIPAGLPAGPCGAGAGELLPQRQEGPASLAEKRACECPPTRRKRTRLGICTTPADRLAAVAHPDHVWALDFQFDVTATGRVIKMLHVVDELTRESLADLVELSIDPTPPWPPWKGRCCPGPPSRVRPQLNGPELTANALRDWCRFGGAGTADIEPGSPWQNPWSSPTAHGCARTCSPSSKFDTLLQAPVLVGDWRIEYNTYRPHSALGMLTPVEFADQWKRTNPLTLS